MNRQSIVDYIKEHLDDEWNKIPADKAKKPEYAGRRIYDDVICGVAAPDDPVIASLKANSKANIDMIQPEEWLPGAKSVISLFMPFESWITEENTLDSNWPSDGWLHARIEGTTGMNDICFAWADKIRENGFEVVLPSFDPRFKILTPTNDDPDAFFSSNWSERHAAFAAGLGTFGLSRGIITKLGMAGRFTSFITTIPMEPTPRLYVDPLEYCIKCGACVRKCPPMAISVEFLKDNALCNAFLSKVRQKEYPYHGCGKCQSGVPCSRNIPARSV